MNDVCQFKADMDPNHDRQWFMEVEMKFLKSQARSRRKAIDLINEGEFETIQLREYKIKNLEKGITEFVPITFEKQVFSVAYTIVHSCLIQHRWSGERINDMQYLKRWLEMDDDMRETCVFLEGEDLEKIAKKG